MVRWLQAVLHPALIQQPLGMLNELAAVKLASVANAWLGIHQRLAADPGARPQPLPQPLSLLSLLHLHHSTALQTSLG